MAAIQVKNLFKIFGHNPEKAFPLIEQGLAKEEILEKTGNTLAINNANFEVNKKETFVIMGLSGSGKSTVIRCLNRLIEPTRGEIIVDGKNILEANKEELLKFRRTKMSMVFQNFGLFPHRTVASNVEYGLEISGVDKEERRKKAYEAIGVVGLQGYEESMPDELSGGMQQRVGLARALANNPEILLMDEAFSALDPLIRTQMQDELIELQSKLHKTIVFITHDLDEALRLGDRIAIMGQGGHIVQIGTPEEILTTPADDYVESFVQNVDRTKVISAATIMKKVNTVTVPKEGPSVAVRRMEQNGLSSIFVIDQERRLKGLVTIDDAVKERDKTNMDDIIIDDILTTNPYTSVGDLLTTAFKAKYPIAVIDQDRRLLGIVDRASILAEVGHQTNDSATTPLTETMDEPTNEEK
jgi:glycine betaine/proline transport system ATP-binding protein